MDLSHLPVNVLYGIANVRWKYGRNSSDLEKRLQTAWFVERIYRHMGGRKPSWVHPTGYTYEPDDMKLLVDASDFMREFCGLGDAEIELAIISKSVTDASKFSVKVKKARLAPEAEKVFLEKCRGKKRMLNALLTYCGEWGIIPENMTEITLVAGFEGGYRGKLGEEFMKRLNASKRQCRELLEQIMKMDGISESDPISKIMEQLA